MFTCIYSTMNLLHDRQIHTRADLGILRMKGLIQLSATLLACIFLVACASPITAQVTSFNQWPDNTAGASFSFTRPADILNDLEQQAYEKYVQTELEKIGLKRVDSGQLGRFQVDLVTASSTQARTFREAIYQDYYAYQPPYRDAAGRVFPGFWTPDRFGSRYVGDREVTRTVHVSSLKVRLLDAQGNAAGKAAGKAHAVFESTALYEGDNENLAALVPYLVRAVFDGFPGQNGRVHNVKFDKKSGALVSP